jgi:hypothetical protein
MMDLVVQGLISGKLRKLLRKLLRKGLVKVHAQGSAEAE